MIDLTAASGVADAPHPWLEALKTDPEDEVWRLLRGSADLAPYHRAEPPDSISMIFAGVPRDDPAFDALSKGLAAWLSWARKERPSDDTAREVLVLRAIDVFAIVGRLLVKPLASQLWREYAWWYEWVERYDLAPNADLTIPRIRRPCWKRRQSGSSVPR